jgi:hypothetical protein
MRVQIFGEKQGFFYTKILVPPIIGLRARWRLDYPEGFLLQRKLGKRGARFRIKG